jgi:hypothetical protein
MTNEIKPLGELMEEDERSVVPQDPFALLMERVMTDPNADVDKLEKMMALREREINRQAEASYNEALAKCQSEIGTISRDAENTQTRSKYATFEQIDHICRPVYTKHGFALQWDTGEAPEGYVNVVGILTHSDGHSKTFSTTMPLDLAGIKGQVNKTGIHAHQSTITYARRNLEVMIFNVATQDDDGNAAGQRMREGETIDEAQLADLQGRVGDANVPAFLKALGVVGEKLDDIPVGMYQRARSLLIQRNQNIAAAK